MDTVDKVLLKGWLPYDGKAYVKKIGGQLYLLIKGPKNQLYQLYLLNESLALASSGSAQDVLKYLRNQHGKTISVSD